LARFRNPLDHVRVAAPCTADWACMHGDDRTRFCDQCNLNVYNLSALTRREAERLIMSTEGRLCVRFYRRADGTILTQNCPVGLRALKRRVSRLVSGVMTAVLSFFASVGIYSLVEQETRPHVMGDLAAPIAKTEIPPFNGPVAGQGDAPLDAPGHLVQGEPVMGVKNMVVPPKQQRVRTR